MALFHQTPVRILAKCSQSMLILPPSSQLQEATRGVPATRSPYPRSTCRNFWIPSAVLMACLAPRASHRKLWLISDPSLGMACPIRIRRLFREIACPIRIRRLLRRTCVPARPSPTPVAQCPTQKAPDPLPHGMPCPKNQMTIPEDLVSCLPKPHARCSQCFTQWTRSLPGQPEIIPAQAPRPMLAMPNAMDTASTLENLGSCPPNPHAPCSHCPTQ